ncbi:hypothetical protein U1Q18_035382 [Sarracenia purpurea var. burkii]
MREDQPLTLVTERAGISSSHPSPPESPSRKRLLSDPKPNQGSAAASSVSALSSDSLSDRFRKKTRDLPNLSDCHSCGLRINNTNPKDKLRTLDSVWRIVLLCRKCVKRVESAKLCSYCFSEANADCYRCRDCDRRIHKDCLARYQYSAPWSYCCLESGFSVCVDCWVPKSLANSIKVYKRRRNKKSALGPALAGDSMVSVNYSSPMLLENVVNDAERVANDAERAVERKTVFAAKAKENALRKALVAKRAVELANVALGLVTKKEENGARNDCSVTSSSASDATASTVVDAELAFQLHRAINSSPRISKSLCLISLSSLPVPMTEDCSGNSSVRSSGSKECPNSSVSGKIVESSNNEVNADTDTTVSEPSVHARPSYGGPIISSSNLKQDRLVYIRRRRKEKECQEKGGGIVRKCDPGNDISLIIEPQTCLHPDDTKNQNQLMHDGNATMLCDERCYGKWDRYMIKYRKRPVGLKAISNNEKKVSL